MQGAQKPSLLDRQFRHGRVDLEGKSVLVTGGTGSFGKAFIKRLLATHRPRRLIVFSRDELKQHDMQNELAGLGGGAMRYFIGDVRDVDRLEMAMRGVDVVVHAAALKHVTAAEYNPMECIKTNVSGAENVVSAAIRCKVGKVVALSTDKAVNPINLYGASKLASDKIFVAANFLAGGREPIFSVVRYGNVVASRGSVIPYFKQLIDSGTKELPITDPRMTRFWLTLDQGVDFVLSSLEMMRGGEIFVPKIPSLKILDLAEAMAPGMKTKVVGIRPGEKLHETLISADDARNTYQATDRYVIAPVLGKFDHAHYETKLSPLEGDGFSYTSDNNKEWLGTADLQAFLQNGENAR